MKKIILFLFSVILAGFYQIQAQDQADKESVVGSWLGKLEINSKFFRIVFNLSLIEKDSIVATLDSPDQGAKDIKIGPVTLEGKEITIKAPLLLAEYTGTVKSDTLIEGTFKQAGRAMPLSLAKLKKTFALNRPQEPKPPFPYISEDVKFTNEKAGITLAGTITIPEGEGPFPAVILITGSGPQNRNEETFGHRPFLVISDYLTRHGIAVLRYDDRGVGQSQGTPLNATSADFATDAEAAFLYLRTRKEINPESIGLAGHSEGGLIAPIVASSNQGIAFIISLAAPGVHGEQIFHRQNMDINLISGADERQVKKTISMNKKLFAVLKKNSDNKKAEIQIAEVYRKILSKEKKSPEDIDN
jgi:alpha/beta superfamily hydrolase